MKQQHTRRQSVRCRTKSGLTRCHPPTPPPLESFLVSVGDAWWRAIHSGVESCSGAPLPPNYPAVVWEPDRCTLPQGSPNPHEAASTNILLSSIHYKYNSIEQSLYTISWLRDQFWPRTLVILANSCRGVQMYPKNAALVYLHSVYHRVRHTCHGSSGRCSDDLCPVVAVLNYIAQRGDQPRPFFHFSDHTPLTKAHFITKVQEALTSAGVDCSSYSGHSFRIGSV